MMEIATNGKTDGKLENDVINKIIKGTNPMSSMVSKTDRFEKLAKTKKGPVKKMPDPGVYYTDPMEKKISDIKTMKVIKELYQLNKLKSGFSKKDSGTLASYRSLSGNRSNDLKTTRESFFKTKTQ